MRLEVTMPHLGYDMEQGKVVSWLKTVGDAVERGEPLAEIETDKVTVEMESVATGIVVDILCAAGQEARVGAVIAYIEPTSQCGDAELPTACDTQRGF